MLLGGVGLIIAWLFFIVIVLSLAGMRIAKKAEKEIHDHRRRKF